MFDLTKSATYRWNIDLIFKKLLGPYKYVLSNYACYNQNISKFWYEVGLNNILTQLISNVFSSYFYNTKVVQIFLFNFS
jgi:hypothetical protein